MKFPKLSYVRAATLSHAVELLNEYGDDARLIAGGQSLLPSLALRLSQPKVLIDISRLEGLRFVDKQGDVIRIGALTRHSELETNEILHDHVRLIVQAAPCIAHAAIRNRGTIGGSVALADPAAELPACLVALDATIVVFGSEGERRIPANNFFKGLYETALAASEIIVRFEINAQVNERHHFAELSRRRGDFAIVGLAARATVIGNELTSATLVFLNCGGHPVRSPRTEAIFCSARSSVPKADELRQALEKELQPHSDPQASGRTRVHLAAVLAERAYRALLQEGN